MISLLTSLHRNFARTLIVLLDQAKLYEGMPLDDTAGFIAKLNRIMSKAL
jgi:HSP90 family molecular chaperone